MCSERSWTGHWAIPNVLFQLNGDGVLKHSVLGVSGAVKKNRAAGGLGGAGVGALW